jgi:hypothetical protein
LYGNNLLGLADKWFISGGRSSDFSNSKDAQNFAAGVSIPYGYGLLDYSYSWSNYLSTIDNNGYLWRQRGYRNTPHGSGYCSAMAISKPACRRASLTASAGTISMMFAGHQQPQTFQCFIGH